jgi:uncharacterized protein (TIGR03086 family)
VGAGSFRAQEVAVVDTPLEPLSGALDLFGRLVAKVGPEHWTRPTPCEAWDVQQLVDHVVSGQRQAAAVVRGEPFDAQKSQPGGPPIDADDRVAAYRASADDLLAAFGQPGALERVVTVPAGTLPGAVVAHLRTTEALVHGWDLSQATGLPFPVPEDLAEGELAFSRPMLERIPPGRRQSFAPAQRVPENAPAIDRLAALLGRSPGAATGA